MTQVKLETIVNMNKELEMFKKVLVLALQNGSELPKTNSEVILAKYIKIATDDLKKYMPTAVAKRLAKNVLTENMLSVMK